MITLSAGGQAVGILDHFTQGIPVFRFFFETVRGAWRMLPRRRRKLTSEEILATRDKWRPEFTNYIAERRRDKLRLDVVVHDVRRMDKYPESGTSKRGISPWFKVSLADTYHKGIQLALFGDGLKFDEEADGWRWPDRKNGEKEDIYPSLLGQVPYEFIETVNWRGDEYYGFPHIFIHFEGVQRQPYERIVYAEQRHIHEDWVYYHELAEYDDVKRLSKRKGIGRYDMAPDPNRPAKLPWWKRLTRSRAV